MYGGRGHVGCPAIPGGISQGTKEQWTTSLRESFWRLPFWRLSVLAVVMAFFPHRANVIRMRLSGQSGGPDWWIRTIGAALPLSGRDHMHLLPRFTRTV
jgi:hypothetical protein